MSHFTTVKTKIVVKEYLEKALDDLQYKWKKGDLEVRGYQGIRTKAEIKINTKNPGYDIGFRKKGTSYEIVADWWGIENIEQKDFVKRINQRYAYHAVKAQLEKQDFSFVTEEVKEGNTIHISVRRMV